MASSHINSWQHISTAVLAKPRTSLAALLGHQESIGMLRQAGLPVPTLSFFRADPELDPNPHGLRLPEDYLELQFYVRMLATWGSGALIEAADACATLQMERQSHCAPDNARARDRALDALGTYRQMPSAETITQLRTAAASCAALYAPHEQDPDSANASAAWNELGAPWFAAETAVQDFAFSKSDGPPPREACKTWGNRTTVWPSRAADSAAYWSSPPEVIEAIKTRILAWATA
jgi:hypothetical protein